MESLEYDYDFYKHYELSISKSTYTGKGLCGLLNLGNKCYMNSILQCLFNSLKLTDHILSTSYKDDIDLKNKKNEQYVLQSYVTLLNHIWESNQLIKPKTFIENFSKFHKKYYSLQQQDSHECLMYILDILHKSLSYEVEIEIKGEVQTRTDSLMRKSLETWKTFYEKEYSFVIETFYGNIINNVRCLNCNVSEEVFEPYNNISLSIQDTNSSLQDCLDDYFQNEHVIDTWKCDKCNETGCNKSSVLWTLPNYLIINLKRFKQDGSFTSKNNNLITFPLKDLNLTQYVSKDKNDMNNYIYDLYAVNYHGGNLDGGHYWSACKNLDGNWYNFNDGNVSRYNSSNLESQLITKDSYILFYHRKFIKKTLQV
jgi:ubiquitin carboxyl-terminal hydrolase 8